MYDFWFNITFSNDSIKSYRSQWTYSITRPRRPIFRPVPLYHPSSALNINIKGYLGENFTLFSSFGCTTTMVALEAHSYGIFSNERIINTHSSELSDSLKYIRKGNLTRTLALSVWWGGLWCAHSYTVCEYWWEIVKNRTLCQAAVHWANVPMGSYVPGGLAYWLYNMYTRLLILIKW